MSSKRYATPLRLEVGHSQWLQRLFLLFITLSLFSLWLTPLTLLPKGGAALLLLTISWRCWYHRAELGGEAVSLIWQGQGWLWRQGGCERKLQLSGYSFVTPVLTLLTMRGREGGIGYSVVLFGDEHDTELLRRLRVRLHIERHGAA